MHIFLTGEVQVGKSTIIKQILNEYQGLRLGGFLTYYGADRMDLNRFLYMRKAGTPPAFEEEYAIVRFSFGKPTVFNDGFERLGLRCLEDAEQADLILMDECGYLERRAICFQSRVLELLDKEIPVLGVIKPGTGIWLDSIRNHKKVQVHTVTKQNRNQLPGMLINAFRV